MRITTEDCCYMSTEQDFKFGEQITLDGELLIPISVLEKIKAEITEEITPITIDGLKVRSGCLRIIDKYKAESEGRK